MDVAVTIAVKIAVPDAADVHTVATISDPKLVLKVLSLLLEHQA
jgi:hypothetical protein